MGKNWIIRTKSNHILGPVSKEKVIELYQNGSIKPDDEICSGNGYWFFIRESELVERYLLGSQTQSFNPISEAKDVLTSSDPDATSNSKDDITMVGGIDLSKIKEAATPKMAPSPKVELVSVPARTELEGTQKKKVKTETLPNQSVRQKQQNYLKYLGYAVLVILILLIYFRKPILRSFFTGSVMNSVSTTLLSEAHAQDEDPVKKKSY